MSRNSDYSHSELNNLMRQVVKVQNPDDSFGNQNPPVFTSYYLITIVLYKRIKDPLLFSIKRALRYILDIKDNSTESYIALKLMKDRSTLNTKEINNII